MLEIVKTKISESSIKDFYTYFLQYVMHIQDENIQREMRYYQHANALDVTSILSTMEDEMEKVRI